MYLIIAVLIIWPILGSAKANIVSNFEFSFGIFEKETDQTLEPIYYNRHVPIVLSYELPNFDPKSLHFDPFLKETPKEVCGAKFHGECINTMWIKRMINESFSGNLTFWNAFTPSKSRQEVPLELCTTIKPHFNHFKFNNHTSIESYLSELLKCEGSVETINSNYKYDVKQLYSSFSKIPGDHYWEIASPQNDDIIALNAHSVAYSIFFTNLLMESERWRSAFDSCNNNKIPYSILNTTELKSVLNLLPGDYKLSIPEADLKKYYQKPLVDCAFVSNQLLVRILIPVLDNNLHYSRLQLGSIPFYKYGEHKTESTGYIVPNLNNLEITRESFSGHFIDNRNLECKNQELCQVPTSPISSWPFIENNHCIHSFLSHTYGFTDETVISEDIVQELCPLQEIPKISLPILRPIFYSISNNRLIISGMDSNNISTISIFCNNDLYYEELLIEQFGAQEIDLACGCSLLYDGRNIFSAERPCVDVNDNETEHYHLKYLVPIQWEQEFYEKFMDFSENVTEVDAFDRAANHSLVKLKEDYNDKNKSEIYIGKTMTEKDAWNWKENYLFWIIGVGLAIGLTTNIFLAYHIVKLVKWKNLHADSENRNYKATIVQYNAFSNNGNELY